MSRTSLLLIYVFMMNAVQTAWGLGAEITRETPLLRDGFVMNGVDGSLIGPDSNDVWFFKLTSDANDYRAVIKAGTKLELLPSATLEKMTADEKTRSTTAYRLWNSRVTKYKGKNFIFPGYFMPLSKADKSEPEQSQRRKVSRGESQSKPQEPNEIQPGQERQRQLELDEPNDVLSMPQEIIEKLKARREKSILSRQPSADSNDVSVDKPATKKKSPDAQSYSRSFDSVFVDRTGFLIEQDGGRPVFVPDALGRNVQKLTLHLLPCTVLELTEQKQAAEPEKLRFKIAGIMTKYKGDNYLLLEKATRTYSHGNFGM